MKLEIKHLAPYLPYKLNILWHNGEAKSVIEEMTSLHVFTSNVLLDQKNKPILRPLSDLHKEDIIVMYPNVLDAPYYVVQDLIKLHFDVFGLIEKGLAIDINTL